MREEPLFLHKPVQYEFSFRNENDLQMKMGSFKQSCLKNCDKILNYQNFENWGTDIQRNILHVIWKILSISSLLLINDRPAYSV